MFLSNLVYSVIIENQSECEQNKDETQSEGNEAISLIGGLSNFKHIIKSRLSSENQSECVKKEDG